jgi:hypothetical protein
MFVNITTAVLVVELHDRAQHWPFTHIVMALGNLEKHGTGSGIRWPRIPVGVFGAVTSCICLSITNNGIHDCISSLLVRASRY